jgi:ComF family protein
MAATARADQSFKRAGAVVAVPMSSGRLRERGFNQSELLAGEVSEALGLPLLNVVCKLRETPAQTGLDRRLRLKNLQGAFDVSEPSLVRGRALLVVDDVITTTGTLEAVAGALLSAGASLVLGLAAASGRTKP